MKLSKLMKRIKQAEGGHSQSAVKILKLKNSKEFTYLVDTKR